MERNKEQPELGEGTNHRNLRARAVLSQNMRLSEDTLDGYGQTAPALEERGKGIAERAVHNDL